MTLFGDRATLVINLCALFMAFVVTAENVYVIQKFFDSLVLSTIG